MTREDLESLKTGPITRRIVLVLIETLLSIQDEIDHNGQPKGDYKCKECGSLNQHSFALGWCTKNRLIGARIKERTWN